MEKLNQRVLQKEGERELPVSQKDFTTGRTGRQRVRGSSAPLDLHTDMSATKALPCLCLLLSIVLSGIVYPATSIGLHWEQQSVMKVRLYILFFLCLAGIGCTAGVKFLITAKYRGPVVIANFSTSFST